MKKILSSAALLAAACLAFCGTATAQSPNGFGSIVHVPLVTRSASYSSTIYVHNPNASAANVQFNYNGATISTTGSVTTSVGLLDCGLHSIPAGTTAAFDFATVCPLSGVSNFGSMRVYETDGSNKPIAVYTRQQSAVAANGFSVEGFPIGGFANDIGQSVVIGLTSSAVAPGYRTNCFVGSIGEAVSVDVALFDEANVQLGTTQTVAVDAGATSRLNDVFAASGAPAAEYSNVRAEFRQSAGTIGNPSFAAFCTVQNNTTFDADFRIAKAVTPDDLSHQYFTTTNKDAFGNNLQLPAASKQLFGMYVAHPDFLSCRVVGDNKDNAEVQIRNPSGAIVAGGDDVNDIPEFFTGEKSTVNNGTNGMWTVEVGSRDGTGLPVGTYVLQCRAGNGSSRPLMYGVVADDF